MLQKWVMTGLALAPMWCAAGPVGVDGSLGAEWSGISSVHVSADPAAPLGNFGAPGNTNALAYDIYMRRDGNYLYAGLQASSPGNVADKLFANLYFAVAWNGGNSVDTIGFEVTNDRAFKPSAIPGPYTNDTAANFIQFATNPGSATDAAVIEVAIDLSVFTLNALNVGGFGGIPAGQTPFGIAMFLSQSFGYSVAGGASYGPTLLGFVDLPADGEVPEPGALALVGAALGALAWTRRSARAVRKSA